MSIWQRLQAGIKQSGISLREVGLVAAVVAVLGVFVSRAAQPVRDRKYALACNSNLKKIGSAIAQYSMDHNDTMPRAWYGKNAGSSDASNYKWVDAIQPYLKSGELLSCPADSGSYAYASRAGARYGSYVFNNAYFTPGDAYTPPSGTKLSSIAAPASTIMVMDGENAFQFAWPDAQHSPAWPEPQPRQLDTIRARHLMTANPHLYVPIALYIDGHVKPNPFSSLAGSKTIGGRTIYTGFTIEND